MSAVERLAAQQRAGLNPAEAREALTELLGLADAGLTIAGARIVGHGPSASADLRLSDGTTVTFESLRDMAKPGELGLTFAIATRGVVHPRLKAPQAQTAVGLLAALAQMEQCASDDALAADWGLAWLATCDTVTVDLRDQRARYAAFSRLAEIATAVDAACQARANVATAALTLADHDGTRYVRAGWFYAFARQSTNIAQGQVAQRMLRVGWDQPGTQGRIKATAPCGMSRPLVWTFFRAPAGWEDEQVNGGERSYARGAGAPHARESNTPPFTRSPFGPERSEVA